MNFTITKLINNGTAKDGFTIWYKYKKSIGDYVIFWGSQEDGTRNIDAIKHQNLPVTIEIDSPEECGATSQEEKEYGASLSIPEHTWIQINPEY